MRALDGVVVGSEELEKARETMRTKAWRIGGIFLFSAGCLLACGRILTVEDDPFDDSDAATDLDSAGEDEGNERADVGERSSSNEEDAAIDAGDVSDFCFDKRNGTPNPITPGFGCCNGKTVSLMSDDDCGGCEIRCNNGIDHCQLAPDKIHYTCTCADIVGRGTAFCAQTGLGSWARCVPYSTGYFCDCYCGPLGMANGPTCTGQCPDNGTCHDVMGTNYCTYP